MKLYVNEIKDKFKIDWLVFTYYNLFKLFTARNILEDFAIIKIYRYGS